LGAICAEVTDCDRLAANPPDPDRIAEGVPRSKIDVPAAIAACERALAADPGNARITYQLGRVSFYGGNAAGALKYIGQAADQKYSEAEFVMGLLADRGLGGDICTVEGYWYRAALQGHLHARVAYVRYVTKGRFDSCKVQATPAQLTELIDIQEPDLYSYSYFLRVLVEDLKEDVIAYKQGQ